MAKRTILSGGGYHSRNVKHDSKYKQEPVANKASPAGAAQQGLAVQFRREPLIREGKGYNPSGVPATGVPGYFNPAKQGPGSGRTIMKSGAQSQYGSPAPNAVNRSPDPPATGTRGRDILSGYGSEIKRGR